MQLQNQTSNPDLICIITDNIVKYSNIIAEAEKIPTIVYNDKLTTLQREIYSQNLVQTTSYAVFLPFNPAVHTSNYESTD